jgi:hypothetical protein
MIVAPADHLIREKHPTYDNPQKWGSPGIWQVPAFDVAAFQKRIDAIVGTSDGKPIVRLVWAWDSKKIVASKWNEFGQALEFERRANYRFITVTLDSGDEVDISVPRWILEQRLEPGQYHDSWEASRYVFDPASNVKRDIKGPPPGDGWYIYLRTIAEHEEDESCCERAWNSVRRRCWGYYRLPAEKDLHVLKKAIALRDADPRRVNPHEPLPDGVITEAERLAYAQEQKAEEKRIEVIHDGLGDWMRTHGWKAFESDPSVLKHGKYRPAFPLQVKV